MKDMKFSVAPGMSLREVADQAVIQMSAIEDSEVLASESLPLMGGMNASIHAVRRKGDGAVFARMFQWCIYSQNTMRMLVHDEPDPFPDYHLAPYSILTKLSPIDNPESLKWRDQSRWKLAQEGAFDKKTEADNQAGNQSGNQSGNANGSAKGSSSGDAPNRERVRTRRQEQPRQQKKTDDAEKKRLRILIDRTPEKGTSTSTGAGYLKIAGFAVEGAKSFVKLMAWGVMAATLEADIARAMKNANGAPISLAVEGDFKMVYGKRSFAIANVIGVEQTTERIPQRAPQDPDKTAQRISAQEPSR